MEKKYTIQELFENGQIDYKVDITLPFNDCTKDNLSHLDCVGGNYIIKRRGVVIHTGVSSNLADSLFNHTQGISKESLDYQLYHDLGNEFVAWEYRQTLTVEIIFNRHPFMRKALDAYLTYWFEPKYRMCDAPNITVKFQQETTDQIIVGQITDDNQITDNDPLYDDAVNLVTKSERASVSLLQKKLKIGYSRAGRIIDQMEQNGVVGPYVGSKHRVVLIKKMPIKNTTSE